MPTTLITGSNRGIGLGLAGAYARDNWRVLATCRFPDDASELLAIPGDVTVGRLDITEPGQIDELASKWQAESIDLLINNSGIFVESGGGITPDWGVWEENFQVHTIGPLKLAEAFIEQVSRSQAKQMVFISSALASAELNTKAGPSSLEGGAFAFRSSKAAMNIAARSLALALAPREITVAILTPGNVRTRQSGPNALLSVEESVAGLQSVIGSLTLAGSGRFLRHTGEEVPW